MSDQLEALRKVSVLDARIFELEDKQRQIPKLLKDKETRLETAKQRLAEMDGELKKLRVQTESREKDLKDGEAAEIKLRGQINTAKSNKEFQAFQHEILAKQADNQRLEDAVLQQMQKVDQAKQERDGVAADVKKQEDAIGAERQRLEGEAAQAATEAAKLREERNGISSAVPQEILVKYERLISRRGQTAMVAVVAGTCQGCFMRLRPETMAQLKKGGDLVACHSCGRILYLEESNG